MTPPLMPELTDQQVLEKIKNWIDSYAGDEEQSIAQSAAVIAMSYLRGTWADRKIDLKEMGQEVHRVVQIIQAFEGLVYQLDAIKNGINDDDD